MTLTLPTPKFKVTDHQKIILNINFNLNLNLNLDLNLNQNLNWGSAEYSTSEKFVNKLVIIQIHPAIINKLGKGSFKLTYITEMCVTHV